MKLNGSCIIATTLSPSILHSSAIAKVKSKLAYYSFHVSDSLSRLGHIIPYQYFNDSIYFFFELSFIIFHSSLIQLGFNHSYHSFVEIARSLSGKQELNVNERYNDDA